jgi:cytochrome c556
MKNILRIALCAIMMAVCTTAVQAQDNNQSNKQRMTREQLAEKQGKYIARELAFDEQTTQKFLATWLDYQKEVWALGPRLKKHNKDSQTDADAEQAIKQRMERSQKILDLREKYYKKYNAFLTQKQIERVYELEHKAMKKLSKKGYRTPRGKGQRHGKPSRNRVDR